MLRNLRRFFGRHIEKTTQLVEEMPRTRYFPNDMSDFTGGEVKVPSKFVSNTVQLLLERIEKHIKPVEKNGRDGLYLGTAGIAYMYYHLSKNPAFAEKREGLLQQANKYISSTVGCIRSIAVHERDVTSFILGNCGVFATAATIYRAVGDESLTETYTKAFWKTAHLYKDINCMSCGSDELFVGRAGFILGTLWLSRETGFQYDQAVLYQLCDVMLESGVKYAQRHRSPCPLMYAYYKVEYLGAAHGLCTILQAFLSVPGYLDLNAENAQTIKKAVDFLLALQDIEGNFPAATDEIGAPHNELIHWCHGAGGVIYLMAKAYLVWKEEKYLRSCLKMGELMWRKGLLKKGPGICHGVAGNGYAFLLLYRLTNDNKHLHRALAFAKFMETDTFIKGARTPDYPYSLYEGIAGTACFISDLSNPSSASFPFSDIF